MGQSDVKISNSGSEINCLGDRQRHGCAREEPGIYKGVLTLTSLRENLGLKGNKQTKKKNRVKVKILIL